MSELTHPHDRFFKDVFSRADVAADFLRHYLPPPVVAALDPGRLTISKDSFLDAELQAHYSDILYRVALRDGGDACVFILFEHKSYIEPLVALDLLRYKVRIWEDALKANPKPDKLPAIIPLVVYHGPQPWSVPTRFEALLAVPEPLQIYAPKFEYAVVDLSAWRDEDIRGAVILRAGLLLLKHIFDPDLFDRRIADILGLLRELEDQRTGVQYIITLLRYLSRVGGRAQRVRLTQMVEQTFKRGDQIMISMADEWVMEGKVLALAELLKRQLEWRFGTLPGEIKVKLDQADLAQLESWGVKLLYAGTLEDVFRAP